MKFVLTLVFAASALTCLILSFLFYWQMRPQRETIVEHSDFTELLDVISNRFIGTYDIDELTNTAMRAAVDSLDDDWSYYMSPEEYEEFLASIDNRYSGIGVEVVIDEETEGIKVLGIHRDSGAETGGIIVGDIITAVDGESIIGYTLYEIRNVLRREIGETAIITVLREDGEYHDLTVVYGIVFADPILFEMLDDNIGYVMLKNFEAGAADGFIAAVEELIKQGAVAFIYDVRSNYGGRVGEMTKILDFLLPEGEIFISINKSGAEQIVKSDSNFIDLPAVVLVNSFSFSGAEYFAAMLSDYEYAITVGEQTTGKNRMQTTISLSGGGAVHLSTGEYLTKNRVSLFDAGGFTPDYEVSLTEEDILLFRRGELDKSFDQQLQKAVSLLEELY